MDTKSKTILLVAFGLLGAFILGAITATAGIAMTRVVAGAMVAGPGFVHGGPHMEENMAGQSGMFGHMDDEYDRGGRGVYGPGMEQRGKGMRGPSGMMPGPYGDSDGFDGEHPGWNQNGHPGPFLDGEHPPIDRNGSRDDAENCPIWGSF